MLINFLNKFNHIACESGFTEIKHYKSITVIIMFATDRSCD